MSRAEIRARAESVLDVPAEKAYAVIADYGRWHPLILPRPPFVDLDVESGGVGAGTLIRFRMRSFGSTRTFRAAVTEPEPGRVLVETDRDGGPVSTFTVTPEPGGRCRVVIETVWSASGLRGFVERRLAPPFLEKVYAEELANLGRVAATSPSPAPPS